MSTNRLANVVSCHAWSQDCATLAFCPNNHEVHVFAVSRDARTLEPIAVLEEHTQLVADMDWGRGDQFVSCSHDSSAVVWTKDASSWTPDLVFTRTKRAALCVRWSPCRRKFAIGTGERHIAVCYRECGNARWAAKLMRRCHDSSITAVAWHPNSCLLASTSTDGRCKIFNAAVAAIDDEAAAAETLGMFGDALMDVEAGHGWGTVVAWSPSGLQLVASSHGSKLHFLCTREICAMQQPAEASQQLMSLAQLPMRCVGFLSETQVAAGGFDGKVFLFEQDSKGSWAFTKELTPEPAQVAFSSSNQKGRSTDFSAKLAMFKAPAQVTPDEHEHSGCSAHSNCIASLHLFKDTAGHNTGRFSTAGWDGRVVTWDVPEIRTIKAVRMSVH